MNVAPRIVAALLLGLLMLGGAWDGMHSSSEQAVTAASADGDVAQQLGAQPLDDGGDQAGGADPDTLLPILTGFCAMLALCCAVALMSSADQLRRRRTARGLERATEPALSCAGTGRSSVPSPTMAQLSLSRT